MWAVYLRFLWWLVNFYFTIYFDVPTFAEICYDAFFLLKGKLEFFFKLVDFMQKEVFFSSINSLDIDRFTTKVTGDINFMDTGEFRLETDDNVKEEAN